jgi:MYXO-CTERM domain-containing protein
MRKAFTDQSKGWPDSQALTLDFGSSLAGKTVLLRFRIATDEAAGDAGWFIDNLAFSGIDNRPFPTVVDDVTACGEPVVVTPDAGAPDGSTLAFAGGGLSCSVGAKRGSGSAAILVLAGVLLVAVLRRKRYAPALPPAKSTD